MSNPPKDESTPPSPAKILVVDDEPAILKLVRALLVRCGCVVTTAENAGEAQGLLQKYDFDCVITDAIMPEVTGYELVQGLRRIPRFADLPILMLTRKRHRQDVKKAVEAGVTDYVLKPIDESLLLEKVELCLAKRGGPRLRLSAKT